MNNSLAYILFSDIKHMAQSDKDKDLTLIALSVSHWTANYCMLSSIIHQDSICCVFCTSSPSMIKSSSATAHRNCSTGAFEVREKDSPARLHINTVFPSDMHCLLQSHSGLLPFAAILHTPHDTSLTWSCTVQWNGPTR